LIRDGGDPAESLKWFGRAIDSLQAVHEKEPRDVNAKLFLRNSHWSRAMAYDQLQKYADAAAKDWDRAVELTSPPVTKAGLRAATHHNLGNALLAKGQVDEAIACFKKAIECDPKDAEAPARLAKAQRLAVARDKLPLFLKGQYQPTTNDERLTLAEWCQMKKLNHAATSLYAAAFTADPKLADDLKAGHRYNAACNAALAAAGKGEDAAKLDDTERTRLRKQALDWLRADFALRAKQRETGTPADRVEVQQKMRHWQKDTDLAGTRDKEALAKLPADEQKAFTQLWADVAALLKRAEEKPK